MSPLTVLVSCLAIATAAKPTRPPPADFVTVIADEGKYNTITSLLNSAGLIDTLKAASSLTLFLPTDDALARLPQATLDALKADPAKLSSLLQYHATTQQALRLRGKQDDVTLQSVSGQPIRINQYAGHIMGAEGVKIVQANIQVSNGFVHGIDGVMTPPEGNIVDIVAGRSDLSTLTSLLTGAGLLDTIKNDMNITVFAPSDAAFAKVDAEVLKFLQNDTDSLKEVLLYHVITRNTLYTLGIHHAMVFTSADHNAKIMTIEDGSGHISVNSANISQRDISADNGVLHVIDDVLIPTKIFVKIQQAGLVQ